MTVSLQALDAAWCPALNCPHSHSRDQIDVGTVCHVGFWVAGEDRAGAVSHETLPPPREGSPSVHR